MTDLATRFTYIDAAVLIIIAVFALYHKADINFSVEFFSRKSLQFVFPAFAHFVQKIGKRKPALRAFGFERVYGRAFALGRDRKVERFFVGTAAFGKYKLLFYAVVIHFSAARFSARFKSQRVSQGIVGQGRPDFENFARFGGYAVGGVGVFAFRAECSERRAVRFGGIDRAAVFGNAGC